MTNIISFPSIEDQTTTQETAGAESADVGSAYSEEDGNTVAVTFTSYDRSSAIVHLMTPTEARAFADDVARAAGSVERLIRQSSNGGDLA
ncbi:hypothetical protein EDF42_2138 [Curtobacterium sp. PhB172]|uniref:hypothetical protein n=1 Tax=Curtobacterium sp. PhB172 TaxID=2485196 RepID=UPI000F4C7648|nr:hypothetical protein [Curtobacterium sp. PhB172]ROS63884.1 hypothetical protein EDF42_2138 [Curtobacterium sp. PhB172]